MDNRLYKSFSLIAILMAITISSCHEDESIIYPETVAISSNDAENAIRNALDEKKVVKSVLPTAIGSSGWTIRFIDNTSIHIPLDNNDTEYITIGSDSCWFVSNDLGKSYNYLRDDKGNTINAIDSIGSAETILKSVFKPHNQSMVDAIVEDNYSHNLSISFSNGNIYTLPKSENVLLNFSFSRKLNKDIKEDLTYCVGMNEISVITPYIIDKSHLVASFTTPDNNKVYVGEEEQTSGVSINDFASPINYKVMSEDGFINNYTIKIKNTGLPIVCINTPDSAVINSKTEWMSGVSITIYNADESIDYSNDNLQIRGRGNTTWDYPKKPYALKLDKKAEILGMPKHKRWVLLANWMDRTLLRNEFAFEISRNTGLAWTPRGKFVEVILNGKHIGNYYLCEQIKIDKNRVDIAEMKKTDIDGDNITGGYLMELDVYYDEVNKFKSEYRDLPYMFKDPDEDVLQPEQFEYLKNYVDSLESHLYSVDWLKNREYADYLDLNSFADWWFVHELAENSETCWPKSSYMYKDRLGKLTAGPVWDFDYGTFIPNRYYFFSKGAIYINRLLQDPEYVDLVKKRWEIYKPAFIQIPDRIRSEAKQLRYSERFNHSLWPIDSSHINGDELMTFDEAVERMISAYENKLTWFDQQIYLLAK